VKGSSEQNESHEKAGIKLTCDERRSELSVWFCDKQQDRKVNAMKRSVIVVLGLLVALGSEGISNTIDGTVVKIDSDTVVLDRKQSLNGTNIEDLNFQLYGGLYSQLLHGECFEEHVDATDLLGVTGSQRVNVCVVMDKEGKPVLRWALDRRVYDPGTGLAYDREKPEARQNGRKTVLPLKSGSLTFVNGALWPDEMPRDLGSRLIALSTGDEQVNRHWRKVQSGSATGVLKLVRQGVFTGHQAQEIRFVSGSGEFGIDNAGLFREGINLTGDKPYEGVLRLKSDTAQTVFLSLRSHTGALLAEKPLHVAARPGEYQRVTFTLTPNTSDTKGRFALTLKQPGTITADYAFMQAGEWGRFKGLAVRKDLADAMISMNVQTIRNNGSMNDACPEPLAYRWKKMIGPRDQRIPYQGNFNAYASHGFTWFDMMDFGEASGMLPMNGISSGETEQDIADFVDYCLGGQETEWGARRIADGHPKPYFLKAIQIGNEQRNATYFAQARALAAVIWNKNPDIDVVISCNIRLESAELNQNIADMARWCRSIGQEHKLVLDSHYLGAPIESTDTTLRNHCGLELHEQLAESIPGFSLRLWPMEENGGAYAWRRGLCHAHNLNTFNRMPLVVERTGTANTFQPWDLHATWNQGRIFYTPSQIFFQPSYYVDRMFGDEWLPLVVQAECISETLDVLAKKSRDGKILTMYLVNIAGTPTEATFVLSGFSPQSVIVTRLHADELNAGNTPGNPTNVAPQAVQWEWREQTPRMKLPARSFTTIRLSR
jgi:hypothetical protein